MTKANGEFICRGGFSINRRLVRHPFLTRRIMEGSIFPFWVSWIFRSSKWWIVRRDTKVRITRIYFIYNLPLFLKNGLTGYPNNILFFTLLLTSCESLVSYRRSVTPSSLLILCRDGTSKHFWKDLTFHVIFTYRSSSW